MQSYFMGLLRTKMSELQAEIGKISREVEAANEEQSTFLAYDKRVKELAAELTGKSFFKFSMLFYRCFPVFNKTSSKHHIKYKGTL